MKLAPYMPLVAAALFVSSVPVTAQDSNIEPRVRKLEAEMRAVQRKVFPGGSDKYFEPEIKSEERAKTTTGSSADGAVSDLLVRVDALEAQLASLTAQTEQNQYKLGQMEGRIAALEAGATANAASGSSDSGNAGLGEDDSDDGSDDAATSAASAPSEDRIAQVKAIVMPDTDDAGEDNYSYGFRLWDAGFYPEAQQQLKKTVDTYPKHSRGSHARNLLGRAYLDDGKLALAAKTFLDNYQTDADGARAPDSLYFLGLTMVQLKDNTKACAAFDELAEVYPDVASGRLSGDVATGRKAASC